MTYHNLFTPMQHLRRPSVNPGGLCWLVFAKWEDVALWPEVDPLTGLCNSPLKLKNGKTWFECKVADKGRLFNENSKVSAAGIYWEMQVTGYFGGNNPNHTLAAATMSYHQYVIMFKDRDGQIRFVGNKDSGAELLMTYTSGDKDNSRKRNLTWAWEHVNPAPIYVGSLDGIMDDVIVPPFAGQGDFNDDFSSDFNI